MNAPPCTHQAVPDALSATITEQKNNYRRYCAILKAEKEAVEQDDDERLDLIRKLEIDGRETILRTDRLLRSIGGGRTMAAGDGKKMELEEAYKELAALHQEALTAIDAAQTSLIKKRESLQHERDALSVTLRRLRLDDGIRAPEEEPRFIDIHS